MNGWRPVISEQQRPGQMGPVSAEGLPAVGLPLVQPPHGLLQLAAFCQLDWLRQPSNKLFAQAGQSRLLLFAINVPDTTLITPASMTIFLTCSDSQF